MALEKKYLFHHIYLTRTIMRPQRGFILPCFSAGAHAKSRGYCFCSVNTHAHAHCRFVRRLQAPGQVMVPLANPVETTLAGLPAAFSTNMPQTD